MPGSHSSANTANQYTPPRWVSTVVGDRQSVEQVAWSFHPQSIPWTALGVGWLGAKHWESQHFTAATAAPWIAAGFAPKVALAWDALAVTPQEAQQWAAFAAPDDAFAWVASGFALHAAEDHHAAGKSIGQAERLWNAAGFAPADRSAWGRNFTLATASRWNREGFSSSEACLWRDDGWYPSEASRWRQAGFLSPFSASHYRDDLGCGDPVEARRMMEQIIMSDTPPHP